MVLIVGGESQGKLDHALNRYKVGLDEVADLPDEYFSIPKKRIINQFHIWIKEMLQEGIKYEDWIDKLLKENEGCVIICSEVGSGIVPMDGAEREWREITGRVSCRLAKEADEVWRLMCGIPMCLKNMRGK